MTEGSHTAALTSAERKSIVFGTAFRVVGTPLVALIGLANTAVIVRATGEAVFGLVSLVTTLSLLLPFADLGIGAVITTACSKAGGENRARAVATVQKGFRVLSMVAGALVLVSLVVMATDSWAVLVGTSSGPADRFAITVAACLVALGIPAGIGVRILIGLDLNPLAVAVTMANAAFALLITLALNAADIAPIWLAVSSAGGALIGNALATVLAVRRMGVGLRLFAPPEAKYVGGGLMTGSLWLFVASVGLPLGLHSHRLMLAHASDAAELSRYALMAQIYGIGWMVFSTAGMALWPVFVKRRHDEKASLELWLKSTAAFMIASLAAALGLILLGPWAAALISGSSVVPQRSLAIAFAALLVVQCVHLPAGVMMTMPREARWQSGCLFAMGVTTVALGLWWAGGHGAVGVVAAAVVASVVALLLPDFLWIPRLLRRRAREHDSSPVVDVT
ncbi:hypothetical protein O6P37_10400 [Mycobacterium sp. CPCC 205372]|uniref:Polysaccharide biosynthesis protein n=1 Tax=Mycobacterium hippophais TaxID=3016340 RepID=A0ABT4PRS4_9MYCO|nr:hypothetical protein [Mycobacterium hippophais]MCZ8379274.1 hypothetical protein [Mycobacterium hippophais]